MGVTPVVIVARFKGGWTLACWFTQAGGPPLCRSFLPANAPLIDAVRAQLPKRPYILGHQRRAFRVIGLSFHLTGPGWASEGGERAWQ